MARVVHHLEKQMADCQFPTERIALIRSTLGELEQIHLGELLDLAAAGIIPATPQAVLGLCGFLMADFEDILARIRAGERPLETSMRAQGRSEEEIAAVHQLVDRWLARETASF